MIRISESPIDAAAEIAQFEKTAGGAGAIVSFLGRVREEDIVNPVEALFIDHFPGATERSIAKIASTAQENWNIDKSVIVHRVGRIDVGDVIVIVCVSALNRRAAFEAADFIMDYLKTKALFWKKEFRAEGEAWIEARDDDYLAAARWKEK